MSDELWRDHRVCAAYLQAASFGRVQNEELFEQVLTVGGHVEGNPVLATQHALSQFLETYTGRKGQQRHLQTNAFLFRSSSSEKNKNPQVVVAANGTNNHLP